MNVTQETIARKCSVSRSAVRDILGKRSALFQPATRERVRRAAEELGYRPNASARALRAGRFGLVALLTADFDTFPWSFLNSLEDALQAQDLHAICVRVPGNQPAPPRVLRERMADGMIASFDLAPAMVAFVERHTASAVWFNTKRPWDAVYCDEAAGTRAATERLLGLAPAR